MQELLQIIPKQKKFTTSSIRMKKEYSKPYLVSEVFEPQEYCAPCTKPYPSVTTLSGWSGAREYLYIDLNGNGTYDLGERFRVTDGYSTYYQGIPNQVTKDNVGIYYFTLSDGTQNTHTLSVNDPYANHSSGGRSYIAKKIGSYKIEIVNRYAYNKTMS